MNVSLHEMTKTDTVLPRLKAYPKISKFYERCFYNTLETTTEMLEDGTAFVFTGDIPAMWLRDSSAQVRHYIPLAIEDTRYQRLIEGLVKRQIGYIRIDPYANAFNKEANGQGHSGDLTDSGPWIWERKYEIDSLCYPLQLAYLYWKETQRTELFDESFRQGVYDIIGLWTREQRHEELSGYRFKRFNCPPSDTLKNEGQGTPVSYTGMTWSAFRPSDDACEYHYLIPSNMFAVVVLGYVQEIASAIYKDDALAAAASVLAGKIDEGIRTYGIYEHPKYGKIYAYETDGKGGYNLMDDANVPSLLSIPYLGYTTADDPIYQNTRSFILSEDNPYYYSGKAASGIGSPHTPQGYIWHIGLTMQALTSTDDEEIRALVHTIINTDAGTGFMHEGFSVDDPTAFTREWFAWANSLFGELIYKLVEEDKLHLLPQN